MSWFRLDDQGAFHAKVLLAGNEAYGAWCRAGQWASAQRTDGIVPEQVAKQIAPTRVWQKLIEAGLVEPRAVSTDPYVIHDFLEYNPSAEESQARRDHLSALRSEAGRRGGIVSGEKRRALAMEGTDSVKAVARRMTATAIAQGRIQPQPCSVCGCQKVDVHHRNYMDPFDVDWLCDAHHAEKHAELRAERQSLLQQNELCLEAKGSPDPIPSRPDPVPSQPKEEPEKDSPVLAFEQSTAAPSTSRSPSPATMPPPQDQLLTSPVTVEAPKRKRATKPKLAPLTVEALTPDERAVHDAIVQDVTLVQICSEVPQLARDLIAIATDQSGRIVVNVIAEVRKAAGWNRDNAGTVKAWTTNGGNRGLRSWIERSMARTPIPYQLTRSSANASAANGIQAPQPPAIVDLAKHPELAPRPMRSARF